MGRASRRKQNRRKVNNFSQWGNQRKAPFKYSKEQIENIYEGFLERWVSNDTGEVAVMKDGSEVFLKHQEILTWKGWTPLNKLNIKSHKVLIQEKLDGKYENVDLETLFKEAGYTIIRE